MRGSAGADHRSVRGDFQLSRRSLVAAAALLVTVGSSRAAEAFAWPSRKQAGFNNRSSGSGTSDAAGAGSFGDLTETNCFLSGTRLLTRAGEAPIETLGIGDLVVTQDGRALPVRWIGRRTSRRDDSLGWSDSARPVRIAKDALGPDCPHRDLYVSRGHLLYLNGVLVAAGDLINGMTIAQVTPETDAVDFIHVELDTHAVLLAEGAPCDSLLATDEIRRHFDNYETCVALHGAARAVAMTPFAPIVSFKGGRGAFKSRMRSALAPIVDIRQSLDIVRDEVERRAIRMRAA